MPFNVSVGDQLTVWPGCTKGLYLQGGAPDPNGCPKFNNQANFGGFPSVPVPETAA